MTDLRWPIGDRFREHLRDVERNDKHASKPVFRRLNLLNHSKQQFAVFLYVLAVRKAAKIWNKNLSSISTLLISTVSTSAFYLTSSTNFLFSRHYISTNSVAPFSAYKLVTSAFLTLVNSLWWPIYVFNSVDNTRLPNLNSFDSLIYFFVPWKTLHILYYEYMAWFDSIFFQEAHNMNRFYSYFVYLWCKS